MTHKNTDNLMDLLNVMHAVVMQNALNLS